GDAAIGIINLTTGVQTATVPVPMSTFNVAWCQSNKRVYVTGPGAAVYVINPVTATVVDSILTFAVTNGITTNAKCTRVFVSDESNGRVLEINPATKAIVRTIATGGAPKDLAVSPNDKRLFVADETGGVQVWNLTSGARITTVPLAAGAFGLAIAPDGSQVYAGMPSGGGVAVISTASNTVISFIATGGMPRKIAFNGTGSTAVIANEFGWVDYVN
ncbi:MAG: YncE family protein, partial [Gemmatimonadetes bacterium]|nr:YncE family protein [Gemmatimonadota bacterium]